MRREIGRPRTQSWGVSGVDQHDAAQTDALAWPSSACASATPTHACAPRKKYKCSHPTSLATTNARRLGRSSLRSQRALLKQQFGDEQDEPTLSEPQLEIELQRILASLEEEESRWRTAAAANERYWVEQAEAMFARWRLDDDARRREQQMHASSEAQRHEVELAELRPAPCAGWDLLRATQLGRVGAPRVAQLCAECGREEANGSSSSSSSMRAGGPWSPATISAASVRKY